MSQWQQLEDLFNRALELPSAERRAFVSSQCTSQPELQQQVLQLLDAQTHADDYLDSLSEKVYPLVGGTPLKEIGHYRLIELVGEGGMGSVYKAFDEKLKRTVAVKVLSGFRAQRAREKERFLQEAQAAAQLNHPNICEVYEIGESQDGSLFIVTAFCEGSNLAQLIGDNSLNLETILSYLLQLCHALETAHQQKIIHRDIKPANIIVDPSGQIRLVDFGVAKIQGHDISVSNQLVGTFAYMSPEQFSGVSVDQRSDIWSIGILLFECLTNHRPFPSDQPAEIMYNIFNAPQPQIKDTELPLLDSFNTILKRCLNVDKQLRFSSTHLLANELRSLKQQLQTHDQLQWQPKPSNLKNSETGGASRTFSEYRKIIAFGLRFNNPTLPPQTAKTIKACIKSYRGQLRLQTDNRWYAYFGVPKINEGAADSALSCALELLHKQNSGELEQAIDLIAIHNSSIVISSTGKTDTRQIHGDIPGSLNDLLNLSAPYPLLVSSAVNNRLRKPVAEAALWQTPTYKDDSLYNFDPEYVKQPIIALDKQFNSPLLGRIHELGLLESAWQDVIEGEGRAIVVTGEAGMGKSRLIYELKRSHSVMTYDHAQIECSCDPNHQETTLHPIISGLLDFAGLSANADLEEIQQFLASVDANDREHLHTLTWLLGAKSPELESEFVSETPESLKNKGFELLNTVIDKVSQQGPILLIVEDLHWADTTTLDWLDRLLSKPVIGKKYILLSGRPELYLRWRSYSSISQLSLNKLSRAEARDLIHTLSPSNISEPELIDDVFKKTEGNPLFIEEYLKMLSQNDSSEAIKVPERLEDILLSRIDQIGGAKAIAQTAAVIGRKFNYALLQLTAAIGKQSLDNALEQLLGAEIIYQIDENYFLFKHALIRDALYESLDNEERRVLHYELADHIQQIAQHKDSDVELIAFHYSQAQHYQQSANWWLRAAQNAETRYANTDVIQLCQRGLADLSQIKPEEADKKLEFYFHQALGKSVMAAKGYGNPLAGQSHLMAVNLAKQLDCIDEGFPSMVGLWAFYCVSAQHVKANQLAGNMVAYAKQKNDANMQVEAAMCQGATAMFMGDLALAKAQFDLAITLYQPDSALSHIIKYGQDPIVVVYSFYAIVEEGLGNSDKALEFSDRCLSAAKAVNHPFTLAFAYGFSVHIRIRNKQIDYAQELLLANRELCETHGIHVFKLLGAIQAGILSIALGKVSEGIESLNTHIPEYKAMGAEIFLPSWYAMLAMCYLQMGNIEFATSHYQNGLQQMQKSSEWLNKPYLDNVEKQLPAATL